MSPDASSRRKKHRKKERIRQRSDRGKEGGFRREKGGGGRLLILRGKNKTLRKKGEYLFRGKGNGCSGQRRKGERRSQKRGGFLMKANQGVKKKREEVSGRGSSIRCAREWKAAGTRGKKRVGV